MSSVLEAIKPGPDRVGGKKTAAFMPTTTSRSMMTSSGHFGNCLVNPVKIVRKRKSSYAGAGSEPAYYLTLDLFPTYGKAGAAIRNALTGTFFSPTRRVGNKEDEAFVFKVSICTGEGGANGPIHLYYSDVDEHEYHFKTELPPESKQRFRERCRRATAAAARSQLELLA